MNVSITPELEKFVYAQVKTGMYNSASEVIREALRLLAERNELRRKRIEQINHEIQIGLDQAERGELISGDEVKRRMAEFKTQFLNSRASKI
ncbi:MAG: type II toxin-antitoxin system ParD family antitoxin [Alphaproteobacteria bacterium]